MNKRFKDFLTESVSKRLQYKVNKDEYENFEVDIKEKSSEIGVEVGISKTPGVSQVVVLLRFVGEEDSIQELMDWIKTEY